MLSSVQKSIIHTRSLMVSSYRSAQAKNHALFASVQEVADYHGVSRKHLWALSTKLTANDENPVSLLPEKRGAKHPHNKFPKALERIIISLRNRLAWSSDEISAVIAERGGWKGDNGVIHSPSGRGIRSMFTRYPMPKARREKAQRYEHANPGDLGHIDIKKLSNIKGENAKDKWYKIALLDDHTRLCYEERIPNKSAQTASAFLHRALAHFESEFRVTFKAILTDNGREFTCHNKRGRTKHKFEKALAKHHVKHRYTRPYRPQTNGKIERFWRIWNEECWQRETFTSWQDYDAHNTIFMRRYNNWRRHGGIGRTTPFNRLKAWRKNKLESLINILHAVEMNKHANHVTAAKFA